MRRVALSSLFLVPAVLHAQRAEPAAARRPAVADTSPIGVRWTPPAPRAPSRAAAVALRVIEGTVVAAADARDQRVRAASWVDERPSVGSAALLGGLAGALRPKLDVRPCLDRNGLAVARLDAATARAVTCSQ